MNTKRISMTIAAVLGAIGLAATAFSAAVLGDAYISLKSGELVSLAIDIAHGKTGVTGGGIRVQKPATKRSGKLDFQAKSIEFKADANMAYITGVGEASTFAGTF